MRGWTQRCDTAPWGALVFAWLLLIVAPLARAGEAPVRVAVAANFRAVLEDLAADYQRTHAGVRIDVISGSTGKLFAQIVAGAPFDLFLAADQERPQRLVATGQVAQGMRHTYAVGRLVLWDPRAARVDGPARLRAGGFRRLALANPDLAPYGAAAQAVLRELELEQALEGRLVFAENVAQAFAFVRSGNAAVGFVALSQLRTLPPSVIGAYWEPALPEALAIRQDMVLLARAEGNEGAQAFYAFLRSDAARAQIEAAGYRLPPSR